MKPRVFGSLALAGLGLIALQSACLSRNFSAETTQAEAPEGLIAELIINGKPVSGATSPYLLPKPKRSYRNSLARSNLSKAPQEWSEMKSKHTEDLFLKGMDFVKKGPSGAYDTPFAVPVEPMVVLMDRSWLDDYAGSAGKWIKVCRAFLREVFTSKAPSAEGVKRRLGITTTEHDAEIQTALSRMTSSIYHIPSFLGPNMESYPFLPITGWDAIISNFDKAEGYNFEVNAGTPSGISNISAILDGFAERDPEQAALLGAAISPDDTFEQMRRVMEESASAWTQTDGISVVLSPGEYNGAHPDVASISMLTGMPLANQGDLFLHKDGYLHLRLADGGSVRVTGIYSRQEESFLFQEGDRLSRGGVPMIQTFIDNQKVASDRKLKDGVWYDYIYDKDWKNIEGVKTSAEGEPLISRFMSSAYEHQPSQKTFRQLVLDRKLYVNLVGGRIIDDKKIFKIIASIGRDLYKPSVVGGPPETLADGSYEELKDHPEEFVIKATDRSGGDGVYVLRNLSSNEQKKRIQEVIQSEGQGYTVQRFTPSIAQPTVFERNGNWRFTQLLGDFRVFVFVSPDGKAFIGDRGFLYRVAPFDPAGDAQPEPWSKPVANTSQGGGYGIIAVNGPKNPPQNPMPQRLVSATAAKRLEDFISHAARLKSTLKAGSSPSIEELKQLEYLQKSVMHLLGWPSGSVRAFASRVRENPSQSNLNALQAALDGLQAVLEAANRYLANARIEPQGGCSDILSKKTNPTNSIATTARCFEYAF